MRIRPLLCLAVVSAAALAGCSKKEHAAYNVAEAPLVQVSADLAAGKTTAVAVTTAYIDRIKTYDGPLHAVILIAPDALDQAAASDKRRTAGKALGPLDGVPILIKDNIDAAGMVTTAGSYALIDNLAARDAEVTKRLRAAGAVILGKTNLSEWAGWRGTSSFNGSAVGGSPKNPYDLTRTPAGSSSGPGIAAAMSFAAATVGSETSGSVIGPANVNGLVGMKPTIALVSRRGIVPIGHTHDTAGPMARSVTDAAALLNVLAGSDPGDPDSKDADAHKTDYVAALNAGSLKGVRLGVIRGLRGSTAKTEPVFDAAMEVLKAQGAELVDIPTDQIEDLGPQMRTVLLYDFKQDVGAYLATTSPDRVKTRTLTDLIAFHKTDARENGHRNEVWEESDATTGFDDPIYIQTLADERQRSREGGIDRLLTTYNVSALVNLSGGPAQPIPPDGTINSTPRPPGSAPPCPCGPQMTIYAAGAGYPHLTVPMGQADGLPVGLSFIGTAWSEATLLSYGYAYEQASHKRAPPPTLKPAAEK
jgi:amidase